MLIDVEILHILQKADHGCPKCQYIMADYYQHGISVPKDREKAKQYYKLLAEHSPSELTFMDEDYGILLGFIGSLYFNDGEYKAAGKYFESAISYFRKNYPSKEAEEKIIKFHMHGFLQEIMLRS